MRIKKPSSETMKRFVDEFGDTMTTEGMYHGMQISSNHIAGLVLDQKEFNKGMLIDKEYDKIKSIKLSSFGGFKNVSVDSGSYSVKDVKKALKVLGRKNLIILISSTRKDYPIGIMNDKQEMITIAPVRVEDRKGKTISIEDAIIGKHKFEKGNIIKMVNFLGDEQDWLVDHVTRDGYHLWSLDGGGKKFTIFKDEKKMSLSELNDAERLSIQVGSGLGLNTELLERKEALQVAKMIDGGHMQVFVSSGKRKPKDEMKRI